MLPLRSVGRSNFDKGRHNLTTLINKKTTFIKELLYHIYIYIYIYIYLNTLILCKLRRFQVTSYIFTDLQCLLHKNVAMHFFCDRLLSYISKQRVKAYSIFLVGDYPVICCFWCWFLGNLFYVMYIHCQMWRKIFQMEV